MTILCSVPKKNDSDVEYRPIDGYPGYTVGSDGSVWSCLSTGRTRRLTENWHRRRLPLNEFGYPTVVLYNEHGKPKTFKVHHLVLAAFKSQRPSGSQTRHLNGVRTDNRVSNLAWGTQSENESDKVRHGTRWFGQGSTLTAESARLAVELIKHGFSRADVAILLNVGCGAIQRLAIGCSWKNITNGIRQPPPVPRKGESKPLAKLKESDVVEIRSLIRSGRSYLSIAAEYGVSRTSIFNISSGKSWSHVPCV